MFYRRRQFMISEASAHAISRGLNKFQMIATSAIATIDAFRLLEPEQSL